MWHVIFALTYLMQKHTHLLNHTGNSLKWNLSTIFPTRKSGERRFLSFSHCRSQSFANDLFHGLCCFNIFIYHPLWYHHHHHHHHNHRPTVDQAGRGCQWHVAWQSSPPGKEQALDHQWLGSRYHITVWRSFLNSFSKLVMLSSKNSYVVLEKILFCPPKNLMLSSKKSYF